MPDITTPDLQVFQQLADAGYQMIPLCGKRPIEPNWPEDRRPFDPARFNDRNAGILTGRVSGILVLDVDNADAFSAFLESNKYELPNTRIHLTGSGNPHYLYQYPNAAGLYGNRAFKKQGFDIRGDGGQIVAPGSVHPDTGRLYSIQNEIPPVACPQWVIDLYANQPFQKKLITIADLHVSQEIKTFIINGCPQGQRSEAGMKVLCALLGLQVTEDDIFAIFENYPIGEKFREKGTARHRWLSGEIDRAQRYISSETQATPAGSGKPIVVWFEKGIHSISEIATIIGGLMAQTDKYFTRGGQVVELQQTKTAVPMANLLKPAGLASRFESVACLRTQKGLVRSTEQQAKLIMEAQAFTRALPVLNVISACPVLVERNGRLVVISGLDRERGIWAVGPIPQEPSLDEAKNLLYRLIQDFNFATPGDRSRALASILSPCFAFGGLIKDRIPIDLVEADDSQAGKGYSNKVKAAVYGQKVTTITQRRGGVGGIEESLSKALISGAGFICLDNLRGKIDSPAIESLLTEDSFAARIPYSGDVLIDPRRHVIMATSNRAELTIDLSNRASLVRIIKQPDDYQFAQFPDGHLLEHVRANQTLYLGSVFTIIRAWFDAGKPALEQAGHDFRQWARILGWIVSNVFGEAPLMQGHRETQKRMSSPALGWLREVALIAIKSQQQDWLRASDILEMLDEHGALEIPGLQDGDNLDDEETRKRVLQAIGRKLGMCFKQNTEMMIDRLRCEREVVADGDERRNIKRYRFSSVSDYAAAKTPKLGLSCSYSAPMAAPMESPAAPNAPDETEHFYKKIYPDGIKNIKGMEPLGAIGANRSNRSAPAVDIKGCRGCEFLNSGYCSRYDKHGCEIDACNARIQY